jgi:hypothetical protein
MDQNILTKIAMADEAAFTKMVQAFGKDFYENSYCMGSVFEVNMTEKCGFYEFWIEVEDINDFSVLFDKHFKPAHLYLYAYDQFFEEYNKILTPWLENATCP